MAQASSPSPLTSFIRWLRLKNYQYEVTFALYMLTPTEKFIFNSLVLTLISMFFVAAYVYLPSHVVAVCGHVWYYLVGDSMSDSVDKSLRAMNISATAQSGAALTENTLDTTSMAAETARKFTEL
ncbi:hypothetical protein VTO42DRAFT_1989 [Malbranchea cinnamomea]